MCDSHDDIYENNCGKRYLFAIKNCEARKRYNRINSKLPYYPECIIFFEEKDKYYRKDK